MSTKNECEFGNRTENFLDTRVGRREWEGRNCTAERIDEGERLEPEKQPLVVEEQIHLFGEFLVEECGSYVRPSKPR
jgi:hypothetical protein